MEGVLFLLLLTSLKWFAILITAEATNTTFPILNATDLKSFNKSSILRYGHHRTQKCSNFEKTYVCINSCLERGYDIASANEDCECTCFKNKAKSKYISNNKKNWKMPTTYRPPWAGSIPSKRPKGKFVMVTSYSTTYTIPEFLKNPVNDSDLNSELKSDNSSEENDWTQEKSDKDSSKENGESQEEADEDSSEEKSKSQEKTNEDISEEKSKTQEKTDDVISEEKSNSKEKTDDVISEEKSNSKEKTDDVISEEKSNSKEKTDHMDSPVNKTDEDITAEKSKQQEKTDEDKEKNGESQLKSEVENKNNLTGNQNLTNSNVSDSNDR